MKKLFLCLALFAGLAYAQNQTCVVSAPALPPRPVALEIRFLNPDGGGRPCTGTAIVPGATKANGYALSGAKCDQAMSIAEQAAANDNGWNDGGSP